MRATLLAGTALAALAGLSQAHGQAFVRVATWPVYANLPDGADPASETVAEIVAAGADGQRLVYTDSAQGRLGVVSLETAERPQGQGGVALDGEPTSAVAAADRALVGVNTSGSFTEPSGHVAVVGIEAGEVTDRCDVGGQPDALALSPDGRFLAVAVENERDEDADDGQIPQAPAGHLAVFDLDEGGAPTNCDAVRIVDLTGLAETAPSDPEPEYVAVNGANVAAVTLQENNHVALVDLASGEVTGHFSAGAVDLSAIDTQEDGAIRMGSSLEGVKREPDAVAWLDEDRLVTANEGDYEGGSRGFTIFGTDGAVLFDSGNALEHLAARIGHYPESRSENKGTEPEGVAVGVYGDQTLIFVGSERGNFLAVYRDNPEGEPEFLQVLPAGVGPEGILPVPSRDLLVVANEADSADDGFRSTVMVYERRDDAEPRYPRIVSAERDGAPIGWGALSALAADPEEASTLYAVSDSYYDVANIYTIDASAEPATITGVVTVTRDGEPANLDLEGIAVAPEGGFWLASEGNRDGSRRNTVLKVAADGTIEREVTLPEAVDATHRRHGFEGVAVADGSVVVAFQRAWEGDPDENARLGIYDTANEAWSFVFYPLDKAASPAGGWVGLSEITALGDDRFAVIERDNQRGADARIKQIAVVDLSTVEPVGPESAPPVVEKTVVLDVLPRMAAAEGWTPDKLEGFAVAADGQTYAVTDNDGVEDASGETQFFRLGDADEALAR